MPTSITTAPGLTKSALDQARAADRGDQDIGAGADRRAGRACASGTRSRSRSRRAAAAPSACRTGSSARRRPPRRPPARRRRCASSSITPGGVHGRRPGRPSASSPALTGVSPSTSLLGLDHAGQRRRRRGARARAAAAGSPLTAWSAFERLRAPRRPPRTRRPRAGAGRTAPSRPPRRRAACRRRRRPRPGSSPTSTVARPGARPVCSVNARHVVARPRARTRAAIALPSMIVALIGADAMRSRRSEH